MDCSGAGPVVGSTSNASEKPGNDMENHLERIPAELRNSIFHVALVEERPIDVTRSWPGLTGTCKQFRHEALAIYLGNIAFVAHVKDLNDKPVISWLQKIYGIDMSHKRGLKSLSIICEGHIMHVERREISPCFPNWEFWDEIIAKISLAGLTVGQVIWPSSLLAGIEKDSWPDLTPFPIPKQLALDDTCLHDTILPTLLRRWDLDDDEDAPAKVITRLVERYGSRVGGWIDQARACRGSSLQELRKVKAWWETPVELDSRWKERHKQYREKRQAIEEEERMMAASILLSFSHQGVVSGYAV